MEWAHRWLPLWPNVISLPGEIAAQLSGEHHPFARCIYISIIAIATVIVVVVTTVVIIVVTNNCKKLSTSFEVC